MHPLQRGHFLFQSLSILHGDLCASHYPPKTQGRQSLKLCPTLKEGSEVWGDHKQIWVLPFPEALLIAEWLPGDLGRSKAVVPALTACTQGSRTGRQTSPRGEGTQTPLILLGNKTCSGAPDRTRANPPQPNLCRLC